jgi:hypothetical protein
MLTLCLVAEINEKKKNVLTCEMVWICICVLILIFCG